MNCPYCQRQLPIDALFCSNCGTSVSTVRINSSTNEPLNQITNQNEVRKDPLVGVVLDSKYKLLERLGEGGMGAVYRAQRVHIGDEVAVKLLHKDLLIEEHAIERFRREARSAAMIRHQNVVSIHDFNDASEHGSTAYIVMELVKGQSLRKLLKTEVRLDPKRAVALMRDICAGVGVAHREGLLHRDLKPDNVIVTPPANEGDQETAKVVDFGLAKLRDVGGGLTKTGALIGTLYYMSPEQCNSEDLDARADVYSLGAMLYEMLSGRPPFQANNLAGLISKHLHEPPPPFDENLQIPSALKTACFRALSKDRNERQLDATAFNKEIQDAISKSPETSNSTAQTVRVQDNSVGPTQNSEKKNLHWFIGGAVALLVLGFFVVIAGVVIKLGADRIYSNSSNNNSNGAVAQETPASRNENTDGRGAQSTGQPDQSTSPSANNDLRGTWTGTYGNLGEPARLIVNTQNNQNFEGVLEQGAVQVSFNGTLDKDRHITMKQTKVIKGGASAWSLGSDSGSLSADGKQISGTGTDEMSKQLGIPYQWTFSRQ